MKSSTPIFTSAGFAIGTVFLLIPFSFQQPVTAQTAIAPSSCSASECRFNQSTGTSNTVGVGVTSSFGVNSSAQGSPNYNTSASASLVLNSFDSASDSGFNSSVQTIGANATDSPVNIKIGTESIQSKNKDGLTTQKFSDAEQSVSSNKFVEGGSSSSTADFSAEGFGALQDLRFKGSSDTKEGSQFKSEVLPVVVLDSQGNQSMGSGYSTGNSSAGAQTSTRFQADITTSSFVNAFMSSY